jgi:hypothetical protein
MQNNWMNRFQAIRAVVIGAALVVIAILWFVRR